MIFLPDADIVLLKQSIIAARDLGIQQKTWRNVPGPVPAAPEIKNVDAPVI